MKCSKGLVTGNSKSSPVRVDGELVNKNCKREPVCLKCSEGLVNEDCKREPVCLKCSEGLVTVNGKSSSVGVDGELVNKNCTRSPSIRIVRGARLFEVQ